MNNFRKVIVIIQEIFQAVYQGILWRKVFHPSALSFSLLLKNIIGTCFFPCRLHFKEIYPDHLIQNFNLPNTFKGLLWWLSGKESACNDPRVGKIPWRREHSLQCSCLQNPMDRGAWWATVHGVAKEPVRYYLVSKQYSKAVHHVLFFSYHRSYSLLTHIKITY